MIDCKPFHVTIPGPPVAKARSRVAVVQGRPRSYTPGKTREYENLVKMAASEVMGGADPWQGPVAVEIGVYVPIPASWSGRQKRRAAIREVLPAKRPDLDNYLKSALDGCNNIVFVDDVQVVSISGWKVYSTRPRLEIWVRSAVERPTDTQEMTLEAA